MMRGLLKQIILFVMDMESEVWFYRDVLGLEIIYPQDNKDLSQEMWVELDAGGCTLALHGGADKAPDDEHQLIFTVHDLEAARSEILAAGIEIGEIRLLEDGLPVASGVDPGGHHFSIR